MWTKSLTLIMLLITFLSSFVATTYVTDWVCYHNGYYQQGIDEERELFQ